MKRLFLLTLLVFAALTAHAQIDASTTWPYYYPDFQKGTLTLTNGQSRVMPVNIHLLKGDLHFLDDKGMIQMAPAGQFSAVQIADDTFKRVNGYLMKIFPGPDEKNFVAVRSTADLTKLNETGGAYGTSSSTASTQHLTSVDMPGGINTNHMELMQNKENGKKLTIKKEYFVVIDGKAVKATKKEITQAAGDRAAEFKQFLKKNKINWKDGQSLLTLFDFFNQ